MAAALFLAAVSAVEAASDYSSVWVGEITPREARRLYGRGFDLEGVFGDRARFYVTSAQAGMLRAMGYTVTPERIPEHRVPYPGLTGIYDTIDSVVTAHPDICRLEVIGQSVEGRDLLAVVVSDDAATEEQEPELRMHGAIHGDEKTSAMVTVKYLKNLTDNYGDSPMCTYLVDSAESWIIPVVNPDGYHATQRYNANGVDLNRNLSYMWSGGGPYPFSEPETQALRDITMQSWPEIENFTNPFSTGLSLHGGAACVNTVWNYTEDPLPQDSALIWEQAVAYDQSPGIVSYFGSGDEFWIAFPGASWYETHGDVNDWSYGECGTVDHTIEVHFDKLASDWPGIADAHYMAVLEFFTESTYGIWGTVEDDGGNPLDANIQISIPDGGDSTPLRFCRTDVTLGDYHKTLLPGTYDVTASVEGYASQTVEDVDLEPGERVEVSFVFGSGGVTDASTAMIDGKALRVRPNPAASSCTFEVPTEGVEGSLEIYDISGRRLRTLPVSAESGTVSWNLRSESGGRAPRGVYLASLRAGGEVFTTRIVIAD
jgi:hypothetical protein